MDKPDIEQIYSALKENFGDSIISREQEYDFPVFIVQKEILFPLFSFLFNDEKFQFRYLTTACGLHYPDKKQPFGMMYQLHSLVFNIRIRFKAFTSADDLTYDSLIPLFSGANWMEREAFDFYGFKFKGHPNLKRILNVEDMDYFPMRKEYPVEDASRTDKNDTMFGRLGNAEVKV